MAANAKKIDMLNCKTASPSAPARPCCYIERDVDRKMLVMLKVNSIEIVCDTIEGKIQSQYSACLGAFASSNDAIIMARPLTSRILVPETRCNMVPAAVARQHPPTPIGKNQAARRNGSTPMIS